MDPTFGVFDVAIFSIRTYGSLGHNRDFTSLKDSSVCFSIVLFTGSFANFVVGLALLLEVWLLVTDHVVSDDGEVSVVEVVADVEVVTDEFVLGEELSSNSVTSGNFWLSSSSATLDGV